MANRPVFLPAPRDDDRVRVVGVEFNWHPGLALSQKQRSISSLHEAAIAAGIAGRPLEISTKSTSEIGRSLSAFLLSFRTKNAIPNVTVESAFQGSKVFASAGPFHEIYGLDSRAAKGFFKERSLGDVIHFDFYGDIWPNQPLTLFYNWIYIKTLLLNPDLAEAVLDFDCFTDIEFNPERSFNCQAYAVALFVAVSKAGMQEVFTSKQRFLEFSSAIREWRDLYRPRGRGSVAGNEGQTSFL
jgi:hypothetical protein